MFYYHSGKSSLCQIILGDIRGAKIPYIENKGAACHTNANMMRDKRTYIPLRGDKNLVPPNVDTIYTQAMLDLLKGPVVLELPKTDRFSIMQFMDAHTSTITIIDCMSFEHWPRPDL